jgi:hypothetical protein
VYSHVLHLIQCSIDLSDERPLRALDMQKHMNSLVGQSAAQDGVQLSRSPRRTTGSGLRRNPAEKVPPLGTIFEPFGFWNTSREQGRRRGASAGAGKCREEENQPERHIISCSTTPVQHVHSGLSQIL